MKPRSTEKKTEEGEEDWEGEREGGKESVTSPPSSAHYLTAGPGQW